MQVKTYQAKSAAAALLRVKAELGDEAVILSNKTVEEGGCKMCEIMAAVEPTPLISTNAARPHPRPTKDDVLSDALEHSTGFANEWNQIKGHLTALVKSQMNLEELSPRQRVALDYLEREGVDDTVIMSVFRTLRTDPERTILPVLEDMATARPFGSDTWDETFHALAGPHGAGKTATLVRLALLEKKRSPRARICVVSADSASGRGRLVLHHYADLAGLAYREMACREDYAQLKGEADQFDMVLIDLPAMNRNTGLEDWLATRGMASDPDLAVHLTLSPLFDQAQQKTYAEQYGCDQIKSVVWTKLDEACRFGSMLNMACEIGLPISALSFGAGFKDSVAPAQTEMIWRLIFKHQLPGDYRL